MDHTDKVAGSPTIDTSPSSTTLNTTIPSASFDNNPLSINSTSSAIHDSTTPVQGDNILPAPSSSLTSTTVILPEIHSTLIVPEPHGASNAVVEEANIPQEQQQPPPPPHPLTQRHLPNQSDTTIDNLDGNESEMIQVQGLKNMASFDDKKQQPSSTSIVTSTATMEKEIVNEKEQVESTLRTGTVLIKSTDRVVTGFWKKRLVVRPGFHGDPRVELSRAYKGMILFVISIAGCLGGLSSTVYFPSLVKISQDLDAPQTAINATVSLFILFMGISPLVWSSISDHFKIRRILYLVSIGIFTVGSFAGGYSNNVACLIVFRMAQAIGSSGASILGAGTVADIYIPEQHGAALGLMYMGQFLGPVMGPPIGGILAQELGWTSTFTCMAIIGLVTFLGLFFILPETYREEVEITLPMNSNITTNSISNSNSSDTNNQLSTAEGGIMEMRVAKKPFRNPFVAVMLLRHPVIFIAAIETGFCFALMFSIETLSPVLYNTKYNLSESQTGLTYLAAGVGSVIGAVIGGRLSDIYLLKRQRASIDGELVLEDRLSPNLWACCFAVIPLGALLFGWGAEKTLSMAVPIAGFGLYNFGMAQVLASSTAYIVNSIPGQGSSATAAVNFLRMSLSFVTSLVAQLVVDKIGYGWYGVLLAGLNMATGLLYLLVKAKGQRWRAEYLAKMAANR